MRLSNPANRKSITRGSVLYKKMSVAPISGFSDLPRAPREALLRFRQGRLGTGAGSGSRFGAQVNRPRRPIQSHYVAADGHASLFGFALGFASPPSSFLAKNLTTAQSPPATTTIPPPIQVSTA